LPAGAALLLSDFEFGAASTPEAGVPLIDFEGWPTNPRRDINILGPAARVATTTIGTGAAHSGEWYLQLEGADRLYQRDVSIPDIPVQPNTNYELSFFYRSTDKLPENRTVMVELAQFDEKGALIQPGLPYWFLSPLPAANWTPAKRLIATDARARRLSVTFRLDKILSGNALFLDDIVLKPSAPSVALNWEINPQTAMLSGSAQPTSDIAGQVAKTTIVILQNGKIVRSKELPAGEEKFAFDLHGLTDDIPYYITALAQLKDGRKIISENPDLTDVKAGRRSVTAQLGGDEITFNLTDKYNLFYTYITSRPWEGNTIGLLGKSDAPPAPWSALIFDAKTRTVRNWNNTFMPNGELSDLQIGFAQPSQKLTSEPISLTLDGKKLEQAFRFGEAKASFVSPHKITQNSAGENENLRIEITQATEFDGFVRQTLKLLPRNGKTTAVNDLTLQLRFPPGWAKYFYAQGGLQDKTNYSTSEFFPTFYIGNDDTGVLWCADRLHPGERKQKSDWLVLQTETSGASTLDIHLVNAHTAVPKEGLTIEFGLQPAPVRPANPALRNERFRSGADATLDMIGGSLSKAFTHYGYPEVSSREEFLRYLAGRGASQAKNIFYLAAGYATETVPVMTYFKKEWLNHSGHSYQSSIPNYLPYATGDTTTTDMSQQSWLDFNLWKLQQFLEGNPEIMGTYNDTNYPSIVEKNGQASAAVFAGREFHQRIYVLLQKLRGQQARTIYHQGDQTTLPYAAYADLLLIGEQLRIQLMQHAHYLEFMNLQELRATFATPLGGQHMMLPQYLQSEKADSAALQAHTGGIAFLHGDLLWLNPQYETLQKMARRKFAFGDLSKAVWHPYWKPNAILQSSNAKVLVSFYERDGDLFIIALNSTGEKQKTTLKLSEPFAKTIGGKAIEIYDPATGAATVGVLPASGLELEIEPYLPKLVTLKK
jgi:hypothetical protein